MARKYTYEERENIFKDANCVLLDKEYTNVTIPLNYTCSCGNISKKLSTN